MGIPKDDLLKKCKKVMMNEENMGFRDVFCDYLRMYYKEKFDKDCEEEQVGGDRKEQLKRSLIGLVKRLKVD